MVRKQGTEHHERLVISISTLNGSDILLLLWLLLFFPITWWYFDGELIISIILSLLSEMVALRGLLEVVTFSLEIFYESQMEWVIGGVFDSQFFGGHSFR